MNSLEKRTALVVVVVFGLRMLGLFSLMPVLSVLAQELTGATVMLVGLSVGIYGLSQCLLQIPMGWLSDHFGRKPVILVGLAVFAVGSLLAALSDSIWGVLFGRALQGAGAIASALLALVTDVAREQYRTRLMAMVGASIGLAFSLAFVFGPKLGDWWGLSGLFYFGALCAVLGMALIAFALPTLPALPQVSMKLSKAFGQAIVAPGVTRFAAAVLILHALMTAMFVVLPIVMTSAAFALDKHTSFYLPCVLVSFVMMIPCIYWSERKKKLRPLLVMAAVLLVVGMMVLGFSVRASLWQVAVGFTVFFIGFNVLEASLPSAMGKCAPSSVRGVAMGFFSSAQFFGAFLGGVIGGALLELLSPEWAFVTIGVIAASIIVIVMGIRLDHSVPAHQAA